MGFWPKEMQNYRSLKSLLNRVRCTHSLSKVNGFVKERGMLRAGFLPKETQSYRSLNGLCPSSVSKLNNGLDLEGIHFDLFRFGDAVFLKFHPQFFIVECQNLHRKIGGIDRSGFTQRNGSYGHP